jgi:hypothetical protein
VVKQVYQVKRDGRKDDVSNLTSHNKKSAKSILATKSIPSRLRPPRPNPAIILAGLDENQAWGAPNFQPAPQLDARKLAFLAYFYK